MSCASFVLRPHEVVGSPHGHINKLWTNVEGPVAEAYISVIRKGAVSAWKRHLSMVSRIKVIRGKVGFVFPGKQGRFDSIVLEEQSAQILEIFEGQWFGFKGLAEENSILNLASILHDPEEIDRKPIEFFQYDWREM